MEKMAKNVISVFDEENGPENNNSEKEILENALKILDSTDPVLVENWLNKIALGILCNEKFKFENQIPKIVIGQDLHNEFCSNLNANDIEQDIIRLENKAEILMFELYSSPKILARIQMAKNKLTNGTEAEKNMRFMDQIYLSFEQFVEKLRGLKKFS